MEVIPENPILQFLPDTLVNIRKIYNLDEGRMTQSVNNLEHWVKKQKHFINKDFSRAYLEKTIIACKGSVEKAKKQIDKCCTFRTLLPKFFISGNVKATFESVNETAYFLPLPKMTKDYQRIFLIKFNDKDLTTAHYLEFYRLNLVIAEYLKAHDYVNGFIVVEDFRDANLVEILTKINFVEFQQLMSIMTEGYGARMLGIHMITQSKVIDMFVKTLKSVLSKKLGDRIYVHPNVEDFYQVVERDFLPTELGGNEKSINELQDDWMAALSSADNEKYLAKMKASSTDESLRQTDKFNEQYMGLPGSFRTLTVD